MFIRRTVLAEVAFMSISRAVIVVPHLGFWKIALAQNKITNSIFTITVILYNLILLERPLLYIVLSWPYKYTLNTLGHFYTRDTINKVYLRPSPIFVLFWRDGELFRAI